MEPPLKRLRTFKPDQSEPREVYVSDSYSDQYEDEEVSQEVGEDDQEDAGEDIEQEDPDLQLEQTRAQLDLKLKSTFEAIFEKYGRDFTGIGDEIDLRTGEIIVDNGHLHGMEDEGDDGTEKSNLLRAFTQEPDDTIDSVEVENDEQDEVHESHLRSEDMEEDDMILFQNPPTLPSKIENLRYQSTLKPDLQSRQLEDDGTTVFNPSYPWESESLIQLGQDLGPKIARYVSQQRPRDDSAIEPNWRTPDLPPVTPGKRLILKSILLDPDNERSPSPDRSRTVWDPAMPRRRQRRNGADVAAAPRGETTRDRTWYSDDLASTTVTKQRPKRVSSRQLEHTMNVPSNRKMTIGNPKLESGSWALYRPCIRYTEADDKALAEWVEEILKQGIPLWSTSHWKVFADKNSKHGFRSWMTRYRRSVWKKGAIPPIRQDSTAGSSEDKLEFAQQATHTTMVSQFNTGDCSYIHENHYRKSTDSPPNTSDTLSGSEFSQINHGKGFDVEVVDRETMKTILCLPSINDSGKKDRSDRPRQQVSNPSQQLVHGGCAPCPTSGGISAVRVARSDNLSQVNPNTNSSSLMSSEKNSKLSQAFDVNKDDGGIFINSEQIDFTTRDDQEESSNAAGIIINGNTTSQGDQVVNLMPQTPFDPSYGFSDDEEEIHLSASHQPSHLQMQDVVTEKHFVKSQVIGLTVKNSALAEDTTIDLRMSKDRHHKVHHTTIVVSSSSTLKNLLEIEAEEPFLELTVSKPQVSESSMSLSEILGPDDLENLYETSPTSLRSFPRGEKDNSALRDGPATPKNRTLSSPIRNPTPKRRTPTSSTRANLLRPGAGSSSKGPIVETPGGTKRRCGENGFKCGKGFCFRCLEE